jgi:sialate O-acetylesterase
MFSDHMVLQRDISVPIWGTAAPGESVTVEFRDQTKRTEADSDGRWRVRLDPLGVGEPGMLTIRGSNRITLRDVLVGEVWIGAGQSNMAGGAGIFSTRDPALAAMLEAAPYPELRLYRGRWKQARASEIYGFSAMLFAFGQPLQKELGVPVGLIVGAVGDSPLIRWLSPEMLDASPACRTALGNRSAADFQEAFRIGDLYANHIAPVIPYAIRGVLWDHGEAGTGTRAIDPFAMTGALIAGWRKAWGQGEFPFLYVQKPSGGGCAWEPNSDAVSRMAKRCTPQPTAPNKSGAGRRRALQIKIMEHPQTAMVTASDLAGGLHPAHKSGYGRRACRVALGFVYGRAVPIYGPVYDSHHIEEGAVRVRFKHVAKGLAFRHGDGLQGFEIAGSDRAYHWADARIDGDTVVVTSPAVAQPVRVRYGWGSKPTWANLFNEDGLPALTFQTD